MPMTDLQLEFFRALLAPFSSGEVSKKQGFTYLKSRAGFIRLDNVCGPDGWTIEYRPNERGYTARLSIKCPQADGTWAWIAKEDGGGFEGMTKKSGGETVEDNDNDEKSAYTNAARRVFAAWGISRELYGEGVPEWLNGTPATRSAPPTRTPAPAKPAQQESGRGNGEPPDPRNFQIPRPGKQVFAWAKGLEQHYGTKLIDGMKDSAKRLDYSNLFNEWSDHQVGVIAREVMEFCKTLANYKGEFDRIDGGKPAEREPTTTGDPLAPMKKSLMKVLDDQHYEAYGEGSNQATMREMIGETFAGVANKEGHTGEVLASLKDCTDSVWIKNAFMDATKTLANLKASKATAAETQGAAGASDDDIPF